MNMSENEFEEHIEARPPTNAFLPAQRRGLAIILVGILILLLSTLTWRLLLRPSLRVSRLAEHQLDFRVDLNQASWAELTQLPGIGPNLADRIIEDRKVHGPYASPRELRRVRGIGPQILERLLPHVESTPQPTP